MSDHDDIESLFSTETNLPKYKSKRWVRVPDSNKDNYTQPIKYNCKDHKDKLVAYHNGYIIVKCEIASTVANTALTNTAEIAIKNGSNSIVEDCNVRIQSKDIDQSRKNYITMTVLNLLEYSDDYAKSIVESYLFAKDNKDITTDNTGHAKRKLLRGAFSTDKFPQTIKIPLAYMSSFFRVLHFPLINHEVEIEWNPRTVNSLLRLSTLAASQITIKSTELILPVVELPPAEYVKFASRLASKSFQIPLTWMKLQPSEIANMVAGEVNYEIQSSVSGINKLFVLAIPEANWNNQTKVETFTNATLENVNIQIDGELFYPQNINDNELAYELLKECMNNGGSDYDRGCTLSYWEWLNNYKIYGFDLSRQAVLQSDPRKTQSIKFQCNLPAGNHKVFFILCTTKETIFDFANPLNLKNI